MVADSAADVLFDGFIGALIASAATVIAVACTINASRKQAERARRIDLALQLATVASTLDMLIVSDEMGVNNKGGAEYREYQLSASGLSALSMKSDATFAKGVRSIAKVVVERMPKAADENWQRGLDDTETLRDALIATHRWINMWLERPEAIPSHRYTVDDAIADARKANR